MTCDFSALVCAAIGTLWSYLYFKADIEMNIVGSIPSGLKPPTFDNLPNFDKFESLFMTALIIAIVGYLESIAVCQIMAQKFRYKIDANQELLALGGANVLGSLFSGFPVVGSFSRTAVNGNTGSMTPACGLITASIVLLALFFITSWFFYLPLCALAAMVEVAVLNLVDFHEMRMAYTLDKRDFVVMIITFGVTLGLGVKEGLFSGILVSLALVVQHSAFPRIVALGKRQEGANSHQYRDIKRFDDAEEQAGILIIRLDAKLFFGNAAKFGEFVMKNLQKRLDTELQPLPEGQVEVSTVLIDCRGINDVDLSGLHMLHEMHSELERKNVALVLCNINDLVKKRMLRAPICDKGSKHPLNEALLMQEDTQEAVDFVNSPEFDVYHPMSGIAEKEEEEEATMEGKSVAENPISEPQPGEPRPEGISSKEIKMDKDIQIEVHPPLAPSPVVGKSNGNEDKLVPLNNDSIPEIPANV